MIKVRVPHKEIPTFKSFCKIFSKHIEEKTGSRLRGNVLLNMMARAAGHDSYTALFIDAKTYGEGKINWETLPQKLHTHVASATGVNTSSCLSALSYALNLLNNKADANPQVQYLSPFENRFFANRANEFLSVLIPALMDLNAEGDQSVSQDEIIAFSDYTAYCGLIERGELNEDSRSGLKKFIERFAEFDSQQTLLEQKGIEKSWGLNQAYLIQTFRDSHNTKSSIVV
jgi:hypothetical protein